MAHGDLVAPPRLLLPDEHRMANSIRIAMAEMLLKRRFRWQTLFQIDMSVLNIVCHRR
jgi:hypothetical protein